MLYICIQSGIFSRFDERVTAFAAEITKPSTLDVLNDCRGLTVVNCVADVKLTEQDLWLGQNIDANKYVYSKFKAEELVLEAI